MRRSEASGWTGDIPFGKLTPKRATGADQEEPSTAKLLIRGGRLANTGRSRLRIAVGRSWELLANVAANAIRVVSDL